MLLLKLTINDQEVSMQCDIGSCVSIVSEETWNKLGSFSLQKSDQCFTSITGQSVKLLGEQNVKVKLSNL